MPDNVTLNQQSHGSAPSPPSSPEHELNVPVFALTPYCINKKVLNLGTAEGRKIYDRAIVPLDDDKFDCQSDQLRLFLSNLARRAQTFGWDAPQSGVLMLQTQHTAINILRNYGEVTLDSIRESEAIHLLTPTRRAQDSVMLFHCLMNSISKEAKTNLTIWESEYMINNIPSGPLFLKIIIRESHIDTNATASAIRLKLSNLDVYMGTINDNIPKFNIYVKEQITALAARGQTSDDLLTNLFKGYLAVTDRNFHRYVQEKQERYEEGTVDISVNQLMHLTKVKYNIIQEKGQWHAPSPEESKILALTTEVAKLKNKNKSNDHRTNKKYRRKYNPAHRNKNKDAPLPKWMHEQPPQNELFKPRTWNGHQWYWCGKATNGHCERYRIHQGKDCYGKKPPITRKAPPPRNTNHNRQPKSSKTNKHNPKPKQEPDSKKIRLSKALEAIHDTNMFDDEQSVTSE